MRPSSSYSLPQHCARRPVSIQQNNHPRAHNLQLKSYSFQELLQIFDLSIDFHLEDLKRAKRKLMMVHPDKSNLPPEYFLFYKQAYEIIVQYYESNHRQNQPINETTTTYVADLPDAKYSGAPEQIRTVAQQMAPEQFQRTFNQLYEENMMRRPDPTHNQWFTQETPTYAGAEQVQVNGKNMGQAFDQMKQIQQQQGMVKYGGVREMSSFSQGRGAHFYETGDEEVNEYIESDPFSKLKFDDLRKVHKDQTILSVSERDLANRPTYANVEQYNRARSADSLTPLEKQDAERWLHQQEDLFREKMAKRQHATKLQELEYAEKQKAVVAAFLFLENAPQRR
jgi:hypothetical protein